jgi:hypothetical protein
MNVPDCKILALPLEEINFLRKNACKSAENVSNCQKLQIISEESAQNAFVNQEPSRFLIFLLTTTLYDCRIPWSAINFL